VAQLGHANPSTVRSKGFKSEYPSLENYMTKHKQYGCPTGVSLGPNGCYFMRSEWGCSHNTPKNFPEEDFTKVKRMWWGYNNAYVIERFDGSRTWQLHGNYGKLGDHIRGGIDGGSKTIRVGDLAQPIPSRVHDSPAVYSAEVVQAWLTGNAGACHELREPQVVCHCVFGRIGCLLDGRCRSHWV
jgi:hypothetical protein